MLFYVRKLFSYIFVFFRKGALSDKDIKSLLGKQIYIYPFNDKNLKGGSYNLTASRCAIIREEVDNNEGVYKEKLIIHGDNIIIPPRKTAIIETNECIHVSRWITGTYHSRVKLVNKGLGHIGTTLDPDYFGVSAIALHNITDEPIKIKVNDPIATIMFSTLRSLSSGNNDNMTGHFNELHYDTNNFVEWNSKEFEGEINKIVRALNCDKSKIDSDNVTQIKEKLNKYKENEKIDIIELKRELDELVCCICKTENENENENECLKQEVGNLQLMINNEIEERNNTIKAINKWRGQEWITNRKSLKKLVIEEVIIRDTFKDIILWGAIIILMTVGIFFLINWMITLERFKDVKDQIKEIIPGLPTASAVIIGWISTHKMNKKKEYMNKKENRL